MFAPSSVMSVSVSAIATAAPPSVKVAEYPVGCAVITMLSKYTYSPELKSDVNLKRTTVLADSYPARLTTTPLAVTSSAPVPNVTKVAPPSVDTWKS